MDEEALQAAFQPVENAVGDHLRVRPAVKKGQK